ncbi:MAG: T9SS type A sorting domain-containing protein [Bacteroidales bacterium]|nr:T9SS type A sorting domain-containing protein [Bacteroidales bacterium]
MLKQTLIFVILILLIKVCISADNEEVIWENDFSNPNDWVCDYNHIFANGPWVIGNESPGGEQAVYMGTIQSSTYENGYALFDSDGLGMGSNNQNSWMTYKTRIDCSEFNNVILKFQSYYRKGEANVTVEISNDSINWQEYIVHSDVRFTDCTNNPDFVHIDISEIAANQSSLFVRFRYNGEKGYAWMIDDVVLMQKPQCDLKFIDAGIDFFEFPHFFNNSLFDTYYARHGHYSKLPIHQLGNENSQMVFYVKIANNGTDTIIPHVHVQVTDPGGFAIYNDVFIANEPLAPGDSIGTFVCDEPFSISKPLLGMYYFNYELLSESFDDAYSYDNYFYDSTEVTLNVFARDNNNMTGLLKTADICPEVGEYDEIAMTYLFTRSVYVTGIEIFVPDAIPFLEYLGGGLYYCYDYHYPEVLMKAISVHANELDTLGKWYHLDISPNYNNFIEVYNEPRLILFIYNYTDINYSFPVDHSINTTGHDFLALFGSFFYSHFYHATLMVRLIVEDEFSASENLHSNKDFIKVIGNPTHEYLNLNIDKQLMGKNICVYNALGQKILTKMASIERLQINISSLEAGVYFVGTDKILYVKRFIME